MEPIVLHQPPTRAWGTPNLSPFSMKLETYLRMADIPYKPGPMKMKNAPKGKVPFIQLDGTFMGDSQLIIDELERRLAAEGKKALDDGLASRDRAIGHLTRRALEEGLYYVGLYARWKTDEGYGVMRQEFRKFIPALAVPIVRRIQNKKLHAQGTGRHSFDEAMAIGCADLDSVAELLGDRAFLFGDQPRTVDCAVYAFLEATVSFPVETPLRKRGESHANLMAYRKRIRERWWSDLPARAA